MRRERAPRQQDWIRLALSLLLLVGIALFGGKHLSENSKFDPVASEVHGPGRAIDGDSLYVGNDEVRLKGIDAPEGRQTCVKDGNTWDCGNAARDALRGLIGRDIVQCRTDKRDKHGRVLGYCSAGGRDLNAGMVAAGFAVAFGGYEREQRDAKSAKRGLWAAEDFENPQAWRHERGIGL